ncbi:hypothetical protein [Streptacidiphilus neutrinimicus]|uniref:hypothetical protein n=1 Tax=Streptacidiphilus neutrinimicus TaxID=105420 RepID=UPI0005A95C81|nr:hypothetical protein [Streptacidiphilus neutrinimicus]
MTQYAWCLIRTDSDDQTSRVLIPTGPPADYPGTAQEYAEWRLAQQVGAMENNGQQQPGGLEVQVWEGVPGLDQLPDATAAWTLDRGIDDVVE